MSLVVASDLKNICIFIFIYFWKRLDEREREESDALHHALGVIENILEMQPEVTSEPMYVLTEIDLRPAGHGNGVAGVANASCLCALL